MEGVDLSKLIASGNIWYIVATIGLALAYKKGLLGGGGTKPEPAKPDPVKPDVKPDGGTSHPLLDLILPFIKRLFLGGAAVAAVHDVATDEAALVSLASALKQKSPDIAAKLKELL